MSTALTIFFFFFCSTSFFGEAVRIRIGALISPSSLKGREQAIAMEIAAQDFNSSISDLSLMISDSSNEVENLINEWGANAIINTKPWPEVVQIAKTVRKTRVSILSLSTSQPVTSVPKPYLLQFPYSTSEYIQCLTNLVQLYNWRQLIIIYEDDDYGSTSSSIIPPLNDALRSIGTDICKHVAFPPLDSFDDPESVIHRELEMLTTQLCTVYIIVRWSTPSMAIDLFKGAESLGMMAKGHVWIVGDDITTLVDSTFSHSFVSSYMQGVIGIKTYINESRKSYQDFAVKFQGRANYEPGIHALQAYDAVHVIAHSLALSERILTTDMVGLSGRVRFRKDGELAESAKSASLFCVINVVGRSYKELGFWSQIKGFYRPTRDSLGPVYWPGGPEKVPGGWRKLIIGVPSTTNLFVKVEYNENGTEKNVSGFAIDVFKMARDVLKYYLPYDFVPFSGTYNELVASVPEVFDAVVGDITIMARRLENAAFTEPFLPSGLARMVRLKPDRTQWMLSKPFTKSVWILIAAALMYNCFCIWYLEHRTNPEFDGPWWNQAKAALWLIFSSIFFANGTLQSYYTKVIIVAWFFVVMILTSSFTASLSTILTTKKFEPILNEQGKVGCDKVSFIFDYMKDVLGYKQDQIVQIATNEEYSDAFEQGMIDSAYLETSNLRVFLSEHDDYRVYGETYDLGGLGFVFPKGSPLAADFSEAILQLSENGELKKLENKWFSLSFTSCPSPDMTRDNESLGLESFWALFLITGSTSTIILFIFKVQSLRSNGCCKRKYMKSWKLMCSKRIRMRRRPHSLASSSSIAVEPVANDIPPEGLDVDRHVHGDIEQ